MICGQIGWNFESIFPKRTKLFPLKDYKGHSVKKSSFKGHFEIKDACTYTEGGNRGAWTPSSAVARPAMHSLSLSLPLLGPDVRPRVPLPATDAGMHCIGRRRDGDGGREGSGHAAVALCEPDTTAMHSLHGGGQLGSFFEAPTDRQSSANEGQIVGTFGIGPEPLGKAKDGE